MTVSQRSLIRFLPLTLSLFISGCASDSQSQQKTLPQYMIKTNRENLRRDLVRAQNITDKTGLITTIQMEKRQDPNDVSCDQIFAVDLIREKWGASELVSFEPYSELGI